MTRGSTKYSRSGDSGHFGHSVGSRCLGIRNAEE